MHTDDIVDLRPSIRVQLSRTELSFSGVHRKVIVVDSSVHCPSMFYSDFMFLTPSDYQNAAATMADFFTN